MTAPTPTRHPPRRRAPDAARQRRSARDVLRGLAALVALAALLVGVPTALVIVSPLKLPQHLPSWSDATGALLQPDDGHLFLIALTLIAWAGWAAFAASVTVETAAIARGLPAIRLPLLSAPQHTAALLVTAITVMLAPGTPAYTAAHLTTAVEPARTSIAQTVTPKRGVPPTSAVARLIDASRTQSLDRASAQPSRSNDQRSDPASARSDEPDGDLAPNGHSATGTVGTTPAVASVTVRHGDTLWGLAERHLGSGSRFQEIADLNYGRSQPDGRTLTSAHWIHDGWTLRLPADATGITPVTLAGRSDVAYTVEPGDTLWQIADTYLGHGDRYPEIADLNVERAQPDGATLTDPDVIHAGWTLELPRAGAVTTPHAVPPTDSSTVVPNRLPTPLPTTSGLAPFVVPAEPSHPAAIPSSSPTAAPAPAPSTSQAAQHQQPAVSADDDSRPPVIGLAAGLGALAGAGILLELTRRRRRLQRSRQPGTRPPKISADSDRVERILRAHQDPVTLDTLQSSLHALSRNCRRAGRALPYIAAVTCSPDAIELILTDDDLDAVPPFTATDPRKWRLDTALSLSETRNTNADDGETGDEVDAANPCPALVTIGVNDDVIVLVNLEAAGTLTLTGPNELVADVHRALAIELVTSPLTQSAEIILGTTFADLAAVIDVVRAQTAGKEGTAATASAVHDADTLEIWRSEGAIDVLDARSRGIAPDTWTPRIEILTGPADNNPRSPRPWSGRSLIRTATEADDDDRRVGWTLTIGADGGAHLGTLHLTLDPQRLDPATYASVMELLAATEPEPDATASPELVSTRPGAENETEDDTAALLAALPLAPPTAEAPSDQREAARPPISTAEPAEAIAPRILLLGPATVEGADDTAAPHRRRRLTELVVYLALHPGASAHSLDEAMWPGVRVTTETRNALVSRARSWLGRTPTGEPYVRRFAEVSGYALHPSVTSDWNDLLRLSRAGLEAGPDGMGDLTAALRLVRGRPFAGIDPRDYAWAEADIQEMISTIVDVAHSLAQLRHDAGDYRGAQEAAARGLRAEPCSEPLYREAIRAAVACGDVEEVARLGQRLRAQIDRVDPDSGLETATERLLGGSNGA